MNTKKRWITSVAREAAALEVKMPWERGARRAAFIARRTARVAPRAARA